MPANRAKYGLRGLVVRVHSKGPLLDASSRCRHSTLDRSGLAGNRTRCLTSARKTLFPTHHRLAHRKRYVSCIVNSPFDGASVISGNLVRSSSGGTIVGVSTTHGASDYFGVVEIPVSELRDRLGETLEQVDREDTFVYVTRHGRRIGAIMPADIAEHYEDMEDAYWSRRADEARGESTRSLESVIAELEG